MLFYRCAAILFMNTVKNNMSCNMMFWPGHSQSRRLEQYTMDFCEFVNSSSCCLRSLVFSYTAKRHTHNTYNTNYPTVCVDYVWHSVGCDSVQSWWKIYWLNIPTSLCLIINPVVLKVILSSLNNCRALWDIHPLSYSVTYYCAPNLCHDLK